MHIETSCARIFAFRLDQSNGEVGDVPLLPLRLHDFCAQQRINHGRYASVTRAPHLRFWAGRFTSLNRIYNGWRPNKNRRSQNCVWSINPSDRVAIRPWKPFIAWRPSRRGRRTWIGLSQTATRIRPFMRKGEWGAECRVIRRVLWDNFKSLHAFQRNAVNK